MLNHKICFRYIVSGILAVIDVTEEELLLRLCMSNFYNQQCKLACRRHAKTTEIPYLFEN